MTMTIWWPRSGVWIYQLVTGVTSVVGVPSTHLVFFVADKPGYDEFIKAADAEYKDRNLEKAKMFYEKACKLGHPMARSNYALWHLEGE